MTSSRVPRRRVARSPNRLLLRLAFIVFLLVSVVLAALALNVPARTADLPLPYRVRSFLLSIHAPWQRQPRFVPAPMVTASPSTLALKALVPSTSPTITASPRPTAAAAAAQRDTPTPGAQESPAVTAVALASTPTATTAAPAPTAPAPTATPMWTGTATATAAVALQQTGSSASLEGFRHEWQGWNNCGPASLAMVLSHYGRQDTQTTIAAQVRPNKDDKHVAPYELAAYARSIGLGADFRIDGDIERLKAFLSNGFPVIVATWLRIKKNDEVGHYRVLTGFDDTAGVFITYDSYIPPGVRVPMPYGTFDDLWRVMNRPYIVVFPPDKASSVSALVGDQVDDATMYEQATQRSQEEVRARPKDAFAWFDLGTNLHGLKHYAESAAAYDTSRTLGLPWRMLWYQSTPLATYVEVGRFDDVLQLTEENLKQAKGKGLEESYYYRGRALQALGRLEEARAAYQSALQYQPQYKEAAEALATLK